MNGIRESFLSLDLFSLTFRNIFLVLFRGGGAVAPMPPWIRHYLLITAPGPLSGANYSVPIRSFYLSRSRAAG